MTGSNGHFPDVLSMLDGKNYSRWRIQMRVIFRYQEVTEVVNGGVQALGENPTNAQRNTHREQIKKDYKALFLIHRCVDQDNFECMANAESAKEAWDTLEQCYAGDEKLKPVRLQTLKRQFELIQMEDNEKVADYFTRAKSLTNLMKECGEPVPDGQVVRKILRPLPSWFDYATVAIEEVKNVGEMKVTELQGSLEAHEQRMNERHAERSQNQALQAQISKKGGEGWKGKKWKGKKRCINNMMGEIPEAKTTTNQIRIS